MSEHEIKPNDDVKEGFGIGHTDYIDERGNMPAPLETRYGSEFNVHYFSGNNVLKSQTLPESRSSNISGGVYSFASWPVGRD